MRLLTAGGTSVPELACPTKCSFPLCRGQGWWSCNRSSSCFCWQFTYSPNHCSQFLRKDRVPLLFIILVVSVVWAAWSARLGCLLTCSAPRGPAGFVKCFPLGNRLTVSRPALAARASALAAHRCVALWVPRPHPEFCVACLFVRCAGLHGVPGSTKRSTAFHSL